MKTPAAPEPDWRLRHALTLGSQKPEAHADALVILDSCPDLVVTFLQAGEPGPIKAPVVTLVRGRPDLSA